MSKILQLILLFSSFVAVFSKDDLSKDEICKHKVLILIIILQVTSVFKFRLLEICRWDQQGWEGFNYYKVEFVGI